MRHPQARRAAVDNGANALAVRLAKSRHAEDLAEGAHVFLLDDDEGTALGHAGRERDDLSQPEVLRNERAADHQRGFCATSRCGSPPGNTPSMNFTARDPVLPFCSRQARKLLGTKAAEAQSSRPRQRNSSPKER